LFNKTKNQDETQKTNITNHYAAAASRRSALQQLKVNSRVLVERLGRAQAASLQAISEPRQRYRTTMN
jgi:hypothetical protein